MTSRLCLIGLRDRKTYFRGIKTSQKLIEKILDLRQNYNDLSESFYIISE